MFRVNEAYGKKGSLSVKNGKMTIHISLRGKGIVNLYAGLAEKAKKDKKHWLYPTQDTVAYSDGYSENVHGFDLPVPALDKEFDCAILGKKGVWYDHKVSVSLASFADGIYSAKVFTEGGSGKAKIISPAEISVQNGEAKIHLVWNSKNYDYMIADGKKYLNETPGVASSFTIPLKNMEKELFVLAQTSAMSVPHEIEYKIRFEIEEGAAE